MRGRLPASRLSSGLYSNPRLSTAVLETFWRRVVSDEVEVQIELIDVPWSGALKKLEDPMPCTFLSASGSPRSSRTKRRGFESHSPKSINLLFSTI
jgi:hypothetical protein